MEKNCYTVLGMMSGTSLDGVDLSLATYQKPHNKYKWTYTIIACQTYPYQPSHKTLLKSLQNPSLSYLTFHKSQLQYTKITLSFITQFLTQHNINIKTIDYVGFHGHTVFHCPEEGITVQAGNLAYLAAKLGLHVVGGFREVDVFRGGQGAPLVPFGEELFGDGVFVNFGGIANVGYHGQGHDIAFCNMVLNQFSFKIANKQYDQGGKLGRQGQIDQQFLNYLNQNYSNPSQKSLSRQSAIPLLSHIFPQQPQQSPQILLNKFHTYYHFLSQKILTSVLQITAPKQKNPPSSLSSPSQLPTNTQKQPSSQKITVYCTGGGALNQFLIQLLNDNCWGLEFVLPGADVVGFKEAIVFGLLAVKFVVGERNCGTGVGGKLVKGWY